MTFIPNRIHLDGNLITILSNSVVADPGHFDKDLALEHYTDPDPDPTGNLIAILSNWAVADPVNFD